MWCANEVWQCILFIDTVPVFPIEVLTENIVIFPFIVVRYDHISLIYWKVFSAETLWITPVKKFPHELLNLNNFG